MSFVRDPMSGAVINTDDSYYRSILAVRQSQKESQELCQKLHDLESELSDIKNLLKQVVNGKK